MFLLSFTVIVVFIPFKPDPIFPAKMCNYLRSRRPWLKLVSSILTSQGGITIRHWRAIKQTTLQQVLAYLVLVSRYITQLSPLPGALKALKNWKLLFQLIVWQIVLVIHLNAVLLTADKDYFYNILKTQTTDRFFLKYSLLLASWVSLCKVHSNKKSMVYSNSLDEDWKKIKDDCLLNCQWYKTLPWGPCSDIIFYEYNELSNQSCHSDARVLLKWKPVRNNSEVNVKD